MTKKAFTLLEMLIVIIVIAVLALLAVGFLFQISEGSKARICETNIKVIKNALDLYMLDHDFAPQSLAQLSPEYIRRAQADVGTQDEGPGAHALRFAHGIVRPALVYAEPLIYVLGKFDYGLITCPKDKTPPDEHHHRFSYGMYQGLAGISTRGYQDISNSTVLIGDSDSATFSGTTADLQERHIDHVRGKTFGLGIRKDGVMVKRETSLRLRVAP